MPTPRPHPFDFVFADSIPALNEIRTEVAGSSRDSHDRDGFLLLRGVVQLLRELRPAGGLGEGIDRLAALVHHCYLYWEAGCHTVGCGADQLAGLLANRQPEAAAAPWPYYAQFPPRRIWAEPIPGEAHEPLDGCFVYSWPDPESLRVLGVFGVHPDRAGFSVVEVAGARPERLQRENGSELFAPVLSGAGAAGLYAVTGEEELLELGWRTQRLAAAPILEAEPWRA
jgi:hypothetical protein